jgi:hypothetical protein
MISPFLLGILAAAYNSSILLFNVGFTQASAITELDPNMWSSFGQLMVLVWGAVFFATGISGEGAAVVWYGFVLEKIVYVVGWLYWHATHSGFELVNEALEDGVSTRVLAPLFHCLYGSGDLVFAILFWQMGNHLQQKQGKVHVS